MNHHRMVAWTLLAGAALILPLLHVPTPAAQTQTPNPLVIQSISIAGPTPEWIFETPIHTKLQVVVKNTGTAPISYTVEYDWIQDGRRSTLNEDRVRSMDTGDPLPGGASQTHNLNWRLQGGPGQERYQVGSGQIEVIVEAAQQGTGYLTTKTRNVFIPYHNITLTVPGQDQLIRAEETRFFRPTILNHGNVAENVSLQTPDDHPLIHEVLDVTTFNIPATSGVTPVLYMTYNPQGDFTPVNMPYRLQATMLDAGNRMIQAFSPNIISTGESSDEQYDVVLKNAPTQTLFFTPGQTRSHTLTLENKGTDGDDYALSTTTSGGFIATMSKDHVALGPGQSTTVKIIITAPADGQAGQIATVTANAKSSHGAVAAAPVSTQMSGPSLKIIDLRTSNAAVYVGDNPTIKVALKNVGDVTAPKNYIVNLTANIPGINGSSTLGKLTKSIAAGASDLYEFDLPLHAASGTTSLQATLRKDIQLLDERKASVPLHTPNVMITAPNALAGVAKEAVGYLVPPYAFTMTNTGSHTETFLMQATTTFGTAAIKSPARISLAPQESRTIAVEHSLPGFFDDKLVAPLKVQATLEARDRYNWNLTLNTNLKDETPPTVTPVGQLPPLWTVHENLPLTAQIEDTSRIAQAWAALELPNGTTQTIQLALDGTTGLWVGTLETGATGTHSLTLGATDARNLTTQTPIHTLSVLPIPPPNFGAPNHRVGALVEKTDSLVIPVTDTRGVQKVTIRIDVNSTDNMTLQGSNATYPFANLTAGEYNFIIEAINSVGARNTTSIRLNINETAQPTPEDNKPTSKQDKKKGLPTLGLIPTTTLVCLAAIAWQRRRR